MKGKEPTSGARRTSSPSGSSTPRVQEHRERVRLASEQIRIELTHGKIEEFIRAGRIGRTETRDKNLMRRAVERYLNERKIS